SLRQAISSSADGDTIDFSVTGVIALTSGELLVSKSVLVKGPGSDLLAVQRSTAGGTPGFRIFNIQSSGIVTLSGLTIQNGQADFGGGIHNESATLTVQDCAIIGNSASQQGGGINNLSSLSLSNCVVRNNKVISSGGSGHDALGGGIDNAGTL